MNTTPYLMGVDLGTSGVKGILIDSDGQLVAQNSAPLTLSTPHPNWSEQDPADWWDAVTKVIKVLVALAPGGASGIVAVGLSGQMHGATFLDSAGLPLRPAILWNDQRSGCECEYIVEKVGFENLVQSLGNQAFAGFQAPKILWVRNHEPDVYSRTSKILLPKDYINFRLTGQMATEPSDASGTLLFDIVRRTWSKSVLALLDISLDLLPDVQPSESTVGAITAEVADVTGLRAGTPVIAGGADNACAALGIGIVRRGDTMVSLGTSGTVLAPSDRPVIDEQARLHSFCHAVPDTWYSMGVVLSAGGSLRWFRDTLSEAQVKAATSRGVDPYEVIMESAATAPPGCEGLVFLPYLTGERTPYPDPDARGVFFGLSLRQRYSHIARSVVEGISFALRDSTELLHGLGVETPVIRVTGGGARSPFWLQLLADVLQGRVATALSDTGPSFGAAILAGTGSGVFSSAAETAGRLAKASATIVPDSSTAAEYDRTYELYRLLYPSLQPAYEALGVLTTKSF
jgi:xylulokinase